MKILFIENAGMTSAGAFHSLIGIIEELKKFNVESFVALPDRADGIKLLEERNIKYIKMRSCSYSQMISLNASKMEKIKMILKDFVVKISAIKLAKYAKKNHIDIIHENTSACYIGMYVAKMTGIKHIWHIREFMEEDFNSTLWRKKRAIKMFNESDSVIAISKAIYNKYVSEVKNITLVYNGIDTKKFYNPKRTIFNSNITKIACVGRVCEGKGQKLLITAVGEIKKKYSIDVDVILAGRYSDEEYKKITQIAKKYNIENNVKLLGQCNDILSIYNESDILCMASKCEAFGRVTVEAMLAGCLVIGSNSGGTSEIIDDKKNGLIFKANDVGDLAGKIYEALSQKEKMKKISKNGQEYALKEFSAERNGKEIYEVYCRILG